MIPGMATISVAWQGVLLGSSCEGVAASGGYVTVARPSHGLCLAMHGMITISVAQQDVLLGSSCEGGVLLQLLVGILQWPGHT